MHAATRALLDRTAKLVKHTSATTGIRRAGYMCCSGVLARMQVLQERKKAGDKEGKKRKKRKKEKSSRSDSKRSK